MCADGPQAGKAAKTAGKRRDERVGGKVPAPHGRASVNTMRLEISALLFGSLTGNIQSFPGEWCRKLQSHRSRRARLGSPAGPALLLRLDNDCGAQWRYHRVFFTNPKDLVDRGVPMCRLVQQVTRCVLVLRASAAALTRPPAVGRVHASLLTDFDTCYSKTFRT
jgi:hypothetical protein